MIKNSQSSIWDNLLRIMPELGLEIRKSPDHIDPLSANSLYNIWRTGASKNGGIYIKPSTMGKDEIDRLKQAGLIKVTGNDLKITEKGEKVIRVMILGDDRSVFEDDGFSIDYTKALNQVKGTKTAKSHKAASKKNGWWDRFENKK